jgi:uncharacterized repeat protein (TIGR03803 family)
VTINLQQSGWVRDVRRRVASALLVFAVVVLPTPIATLSAQAQTYTVLYSFKGVAAGDADSPVGGLVQDSAGNLYGTTYYGGVGTFGGYGTIYELETSGNERVLYRFGSHAGDGTRPFGGLVRDAADNFFGTTSAGGAFGFGTVFELNVHGMTLLHSFSGSPDGNFPAAALFRLPEPDGILYGTTIYGGTYGCGTMFSLDKSGNETVVHSFALGDGGGPGANLGAPVRAPGEGILRLYGTTIGGIEYCFPPTHSGNGTVYEITSNGNARVLHRFTGAAGGKGPNGGLILDTAGNLYGTTADGGTNKGPCNFYRPGCGIVFKIDTSGNYTVLHTFTDGQNIELGGATLVLDSVGNLYGITEGVFGYFGVLFKLDTSGSYTVVHQFTGGTEDGSYPTNLLLGADGNLYGTTLAGGAFNKGTVFKLTP